MTENKLRTAQIERATKETQIRLDLNIDGSGCAQIATGCGFLDHMLELFTAHSGFDLQIACQGDVQVDYHHTTEDVAIALGQALTQALGDKRGINRYGQQLLPMDEALVLVALDFSGRAYLGYDVQLLSTRVGDFDTELAEEFMQALCRNAGLTLHIRQMCGHNTHHIIEAMFKGVGRAMRQAVAVDARFAERIPSTKGVI